MMRLDLQVVMAEIRQIAQEELLPRFENVGFSLKKDGSLLTEADLATNRRIRDFLQARWPEIAFLSEEMERHEQEKLLREADALWCLDPLDGTSNFVAGIPLFAVSLALLHKGEVVLALIYDPLRDEMFSAEKEGGAWLNGKRLQCRESGFSLRHAVAIVDFKRLTSRLKQALVEGAPYGSQRNIGSCVLEWAWMAANRGHLYLHGGMKLWDLAAGTLILGEAGGRACTLQGETVFKPAMEPRSVVISPDRSLFDEWFRYLQCHQYPVEKSEQAIGVFDSGLGGISVLREIHRLLPSEDLIYVADSAHTPYGGKTPDYIRARSKQVADFLLEQQVKVLVVACNTATAHAVDYLRAALPVPVVGIEPAVKPAARMTQSGVIGVLATEMTVKSPRLQRLIQEHAANVRVIAQACPGLVEHVEAGDFHSEDLRHLLQHYISPLLDAGVDTLVLGCTHYPFLSEAVHDVTHGRVNVLETSIPVTHQLMRVLERDNLGRHQDQPGKVDFFSSLSDPQHHVSMQVLWEQPLELRLLPPDYR